LDIRVSGDQPAHGILGQNLVSPRNGNIDKYPKHGSYETVAQAEGAIQGTYTDYIVMSPFVSHDTFVVSNTTSPVGTHVVDVNS